MYIGYDAQPMAPGESESFTFDFVNDVGSGETVSSATWTLTVKEGTDATPESHLSGSPVNSGTKTSQRLQGLLDGVTYVLATSVVTSAGNTLELYTHLPCAAAS